MITKRLKIIFALSIPLFILHGIEEMYTKFYEVDAWDLAISSPLLTLSTHGAIFTVFQIMLWLLLVLSLLLIWGEKTRFYTVSIIGVVYIFELHHVIKAIIAGGYYPGLITGLLFPIVAVLFWKEWLSVWNKTRKI